MRATALTAGAVQVLGKYLAPFAAGYGGIEGMGGDDGWVSGQYATQLREDGSFTVRMANTVGADGVLHRDRFALTSKDDADYVPGEEWIEFYLGDALQFVGTPVSYTLTRSALEITGVDSVALLSGSRTGEVETWAHAPRDVFEHYTGAVIVPEAEDFTLPSAPQFAGTGTTTDSRYTYTTANTVANGVSIAAGGSVRQAAGLSVDRNSSWRVDVIVDNPAVLQVITAGGIGVELRYNTAATPFYSIGTTAGAGNYQVSVAVPPSDIGTVATYSVVTFDNWTFGYVNGRLIGVVPTFPNSSGIALPVTIRPRVNASVSANPIVLRQITCETRQPFLSRGAAKGDYRVPGLPTPGGLRGRYYTEIDTFGRASGSSPWTIVKDCMLAPTLKWWASRLDPTVDMGPGNPPVWQPEPAAHPTFFSARWTGSIYLDLTGNGRRISVSADDEARVWIGKTRHGQEVAVAAASTVTSGNLRDIFGPIAGWFPIVIEYRQTDVSGGVQLMDSALDSGGSALGYTVVPATRLSPDGCFENQIRLDAYREIINQITDGFGYQWICSPRSLESAEFPGQVIPQLRVGRDTEVVLDKTYASAFQASGSAQDTVDTLLADAAGIADQNTTLTGRAMATGLARGHLLQHADYVSLSEISEPAFLAKRMASMLALREYPFEEVQAQPGALRQLVDTFPLTGQLALFDWSPGDALRIDLTDINVSDTTLRQFTGVTWPVSPTGRGAPQVTFRQRPRGIKQLLREIKRESRNQARNYQTQLGLITSNTAAAPATSDIPDTYARMALPDNLADVVEAKVAVQLRTGSTATPFTLSINGTATPITVNTADRFDISPYLARVAAAGENRIYVTGTGGTGLIHFAIELKVRI